MDPWRCSKCGETIGKEFDICWNCGTHRDGSPPESNFVRDDTLTSPGERVPPSRVLSCLRCSASMSLLGRKRFHEGSQALPFLIGNLGELFVHRQSFEVYVCPSCGKAEFFVTS
jgi:hypothetical protein